MPAVHRCRFVNYTPSAINALAFEQHAVTATDDAAASRGGGAAAAVPARTTRLAISRANGDIELWNVSHDWHLERFIRGGEDASVESIAWHAGRLFSGGLHSTVTEWDLKTLMPKASVDSFGGPVWAIAVNHAGTRLAAGCEDGCVKLFDIEDGKLEYIRSLDKQEGRVLAVAWHEDDEIVVAGGADSTIRVLVAETGRTRLRITLGAAPDAATLVWSICVLKDMTIVSGDSRGHTEFWNGTFGTLEESFNQHEADVLTLVANEAEDTVYASGVDNKVVQLKRLRSDPKRRWVMAGRARDHTHDVRSIALGPNHELVTGGVDTNLIVYSDSNFGEAGSSHRKIPPFPQQPFISFAKKAEVLLIKHLRKLQLWRMGSVQQQSGDGSAAATEEAALLELQQQQQIQAGGAQQGATVLGIERPPALLLELTPFSLDNMTCSTLSTDANFVAYSCVSGTRVFTMEQHEDGTVQVARVKKLPRDLAAAQAMSFTPEGSKLVLLGFDRRVQVLDLDTLTLMTSEPCKEDGTSALPGAHLLSISADGSQAAVSCDLAIRIFDLKTCEEVVAVPRLDSQHTAFAFAPGGFVLVIVCTNNKIYMYDTAEEDFTAWSKQNCDMLPHQWLRRKEKVVGISFSKALPNACILFDHSSMCVLRTDQPMPNRNVDLGKAVNRWSTSATAAAAEVSAAAVAAGGKGRGSKRKPAEVAGEEPEPEAGEGAGSTESSSNFKLIRRFQPLLFADFSDAGAMVVVERPWLAVMAGFPPPLYRTKYGT